MKNPVLLSILCLAPMLAAVQAPPQAAPGRGGPQRIAGVGVRPDRTILFRIAAPRATEVSLVFSEGDPKPRPMTKDASGVWSLTLGPVEPEIYRYWFEVDGVKTIDISNRDVKVSSVVEASLVEVPGNPPRYDQVQNVPHGSVNVHTYMSATLGRQRALGVYIPPEYYTQKNKKFPVLYLWHGGGGCELDWVNEGHTDVILDNLIAQEKAVPMIIVIPNGDVGGPGCAALWRGHAALRHHREGDRQRHYPAYREALPHPVEPPEPGHRGAVGGRGHLDERRLETAGPVRLGWGVQLGYVWRRWRLRAF
jgi:hypothetical protein